MKSPHKFSIVLSTFFGALIPLAADAASIYSISIANATVAPNGVAEISVLVTGAGESINLVGYEFRLSPTGGTTSQLQFLEESESFLSDASYMFASNSFAASDGTPSSVGTVSTGILPSDTFVGGDSTNDLSDVAISGSKLLVKLGVKHLTGPADPATTIGHSFSISLVPASGDSSAFAGGTSNTGFVDGALAGVGFASQTGTVTVVVPEPSAIFLAICCALPVAFCIRRPQSMLPTPK